MKVTLLSDLLVQPLSGVGRYGYELATRLQEDSAVSVLAFLSYRGEEFWADIERRVAIRIDSAVNAKWKVARLRAWLVNTKLGSASYSAVTRVQHSRFASRFAGSVLHAPTLQQLPSARLHGRRVMTVHDVSHCINPAWHPAQRVQRLGAAMRQLATVHAVIAVSQSTADTLIQRGFVTASAVRVVHNGVSPIFSMVASAHNEVSRRGALCVSTIEPRKNIGTLLDAYSTLPKRILNDHPLTLVGEYGWNSAQIHASISEYQAQGWLRYLGYVSDATLATLYSQSSLALYPSLYEGFGLPVLEALATGTPVIAGNHSSIPEVAGGHARLLDDVTSIDEMRELILAELHAPWDADAAVARMAYARQFTWERTATQTVGVYQRTLGMAGSPLR